MGAVYQDYAGSTPQTPGGHYRIGLKSGAVTGLTAGQTMFCFRWTSTTLTARLHGLKVAATMNTAFGTAQVSDISMSRAYAWATAPTAGVSLTAAKVGENVAVRTQGVLNPMVDLATVCPVAATNFAIANTGVLTTGSPSIDANPLAYDVFNIIALGSSDRVTLVDEKFGLDYPLSFGAQEGFVLQVPTAQGATGVVVYYVDLVMSFSNANF